MGTYLNPDNRMFQTLLNGNFYVDKTGLASFMNARLDTPEKFVCVSRPRRFGKSVDADMMVAYYSKGADSRSQFEGLDVSRDPSFEEHLNAHDVIKLDMTKMLRGRSEMGSLGPAIDRLVVPEIRDAWPDAVPEDVDSLSRSLELAAAKGSGFVLVIDEWDFVMREAKGDAQAQDDYLYFLRLLLKDAPYVDACYMTGILPIKKYSVHSALNMFREYTFTDPKDLAHLVGFNADEVERLCGRFDMDYAEMARWYDGYLLGSERIHVYNPNSVACAISSGVYSNYWTVTETYEALSVYIDMDFDGLAQELVAMLDGAHVAADVDHFNNTMTDTTAHSCQIERVEL